MYSLSRTTISIIKYRNTSKLLNQQNELISKCGHKNRYKLMGNYFTLFIYIYIYIYSVGAINNGKYFPRLIDKHFNEITHGRKMFTGKKLKSVILAQLIHTKSWATIIKI